jgi:hypothetical protein
VHLELFFDRIRTLLAPSVITAIAADQLIVIPHLSWLLSSLRSLPTAKWRWREAVDSDQECKRP